MSRPHSAAASLDREFLGIRLRLIDLAATLDRIDRANDSSGSDTRWLRIRRGLEMLAKGRCGRAEEIERLFSLPFDE